MIGAALPTRTGSRVGLLAGFWVFVGLFGGTCVWIGERLTGAQVSWSQAAASGLVAALLWVPITLAAVALALRLPLSADRWQLPLMIHGFAAVAVSFVLNFLFFGVEIAVTGRGMGVAWLVATAAAGFRYLHINALVYLVIVGVVQAYLALQARGASAPGTERVRQRPDDMPTRGSSYATRLTAGSAGRMTLIEVGDIRWIEADGDYARVHLDDGEHLVSKRMKQLEGELDPTRFVRIHRSRIVNVQHLRELRHVAHGDYEVTLDDDTELRVSRARRKQLLAVVERSRGHGGDHRLPGSNPARRSSRQDTP